MVKKKTTNKKLSKLVPRVTSREASTMNDVKSAVLLVSLLINLAVFVGWLAIKLTNQYDEQVAQFLFGN